VAEPVLISACLLGVPCRYDGKSKPAPIREASLLPVCPEVLAGFGIPRPAIERGEDGRIRVLESHEDVTERLTNACDSIIARAQSAGVRRAVLKERSPSCGSSQLIRDGRVVAGEGLLTERLRAVGIEVCSE